MKLSERIKKLTENKKELSEMDVVDAILGEFADLSVYIEDQLHKDNKSAEALHVMSVMGAFASEIAANVCKRLFHNEEKKEEEK